MAADVTNPCCAALRVRYLNLEGKRNALREGVKILRDQIDRLQSENLNLKKACDEQRAWADAEGDEKAKEASIRISLEKEIVELKSEISLMQQGLCYGNEKLGNEERAQSDAEIDEKAKEASIRIALQNEIAELKSELSSMQQRVCPSDPNLDNKVVLLQQNVSEREEEIGRLKELLTEEKRRADEGRESAEIEKKKAAELQEALKHEKNGAEEARKLAESEGKKAEDIKYQLGILRNEVEKLRCQYEDTQKKLEGEKQKVLKEKERADEEKAKAVQQRKLDDENVKKVLEEKSRADNLLMQLEDEKKKVERLQKEIQEMMTSKRYVDFSELEGLQRKLEAEKKKVVEEKKRADIEMSKAEELRNLVETSRKKAMDEKIRADGLSQQLVGHECRIQELEKKLQEANMVLEVEKNSVIREQKCAEAQMLVAEEQRKLAEANSRKVEDEGLRADKLSKELDNDKRKISKLEKELLELKICRNSSGAPPAATLDVTAKEQTARMNLLREQLKFEKKRVKHAKQVGKLEKDRNSILQQELHRMKQDFVHMLYRLDTLDNNFCHGNKILKRPLKMRKLSKAQGVALDGTMLGVRPSGISDQDDLELGIPSSSSKGPSDCLKPTVGYVQPQNCIKPFSGTETTLGPLLAGSCREILPSSAINFNTASFSDEQLVGSQERATGSLTTSATLAEENSNPQPVVSRSNEHKKGKSGQNLAVVAENSIRSPLKCFSGRVLNRRKVLDEFETIEHMHSEGKRLHQEMEEKMSLLHDMLDNLTAEQIENRSSLVIEHKNDHDMSCKRKGSKDFEVSGWQFSVSNKRRKRENMGTLDTLPAADTKFSLPHDDRFRDLIGCDQDAMARFDQVLGGDYMKLLELDNVIDEDKFQMAMERPLSPTLPVLNLLNKERGHVDQLKGHMEDMCNKGLSSNQNTFGQSFSFDNEASHSRKLEGNHANIPLKESEGGIIGDCSKIRTSNENGSSGSSVKMHISNEPPSNCDVRRTTCNSESGSPNEFIQPSCIVFSGMDISSMTRIFCAVGRCIAQHCLFSQSKWLMRDLLVAIASEKQLMSRERVCVLFSLMVCNFSAASSTKSDYSQEHIDSFSIHICSVLFDAETRNLFSDICDLSELLTLIENFLLCKKILSKKSVNIEYLHDYASSFNVMLEGVESVLYFQTASTCLVVAGSIILASICAAVDRIGFVCEVSFKIMQIYKDEASLILTILHVFVCICGEKYLSAGDYHLLMMVLKSMVMFTERSLNAKPASHPQFLPCAKCPFSEGSSSFDEVFSVLWEELQNYALSPNLLQSLVDLANLSHPGSCYDKGLAGIFCYLDSTAAPSCGNIENLYRMNDVLSLVELIASCTDWDWTCRTILPQILKRLDTCDSGILCTVLVLLLGQLGRIGMELHGFQDAGVQTIKITLSTFLCQKSSSKCDSPLMFATVSALVNLNPEYYKLIVGNMDPAADIHHSMDFDIARRCISSMAKEQKSLMFNL